MHIKTFLAAALALAMIPIPVFADKIKVGEMAPKFEITLIDGTKIRSEELRGQVVVLNFWATWCVPCRTELPTLDSYYRIQKKYGLRVFAVATEDSLPVYKMKPLFEKLAIESARRIKGAYDDIPAVPTNYIIGRDGRIRYAKAGALDLDDLNAILVPLLREPAPAAPAGG